MSSGTSTEPDALQPWQLFTLAGLIGATAVVFLASGQSPAAIVLLSLTVFAAAAVGAAAWRTFGPLAGDDDMAAQRTLGGRTRAALEREKALALRSIKELEFDRAMGKVSDRDFAEMTTRLRARAVRLIRQLDAGAGYREAIERELERRLPAAPGGVPPAAAALGSAPDGTPAAPTARVPLTGPPEGAAAAVTVPASMTACSACGADNDPDARFCKHCGTRMERA
ncbi:MAG: zinc ribbon domain-containing protein [Vicinamibacterales bacterium]